MKRLLLILAILDLLAGAAYLALVYANPASLPSFSPPFAGLRLVWDYPPADLLITLTLFTLAISIIAAFTLRQWVWLGVFVALALAMIGEPLYSPLFALLFAAPPVPPFPAPYVPPTAPAPIAGDWLVLALHIVTPLVALVYALRTSPAPARLLRLAVMASAFCALLTLCEEIAGFVAISQDLPDVSLTPGQLYDSGAFALPLLLLILTGLLALADAIRSQRYGWAVAFAALLGIAPLGIFARMFSTFGYSATPSDSLGLIVIALEYEPVLIAVLALVYCALRARVTRAKEPLPA